jgi:TM2 domain-containing membrane protein YozV
VKTPTSRPSAISCGCSVLPVPTVSTTANPSPARIWFFTLGLLGIGWIIDLFLIPGMDRRADLRFQEGSIDYTLAWILLTFLGIFGVHRMYMGKWLSGLLYLLTGGLFLIGYVYDYWTLNDQISMINRAAE